jgi:hypothetical protein
MTISALDLKRFNEILDELNKDLFFEHYKKLKDFYEYLATTYQFDLRTYTVYPSNGEIVPIGGDDKSYFDKMTT